MSTHDTDSPTASSVNGHASAPLPPESDSKSSAEAGRALLAGLLGGVATAVGYMIYSRLEPDQKEKLHGTVRGVVESRISEIRSNFNL